MSEDEKVVPSLREGTWLIMLTLSCFGSERIVDLLTINGVVGKVHIVSVRDVGGRIGDSSVVSGRCIGDVAGGYCGVYNLDFLICVGSLIKFIRPVHGSEDGTGTVRHQLARLSSAHTGNLATAGT